jgi:hypothetical protein
MRRTLIQLDEAIYRRLRQRAFREERSISSLVRDMVADGLERGPGRNRPARGERFASIAAGRSKQGRLSPVSERHDEALADAFDE